MQTYDVVIIGAGHNGLTCAAYLGMAGLKVKVLERRSVAGGAAVTEEFFPGFRNSVAAYTVSLLNPKIIADLRLFEHGLRIVERRAQNFLPTSTANIFSLPKVIPKAISRSSAAPMPNGTLASTGSSTRAPTCCASWSCRRRPTWCAGSISQPSANYSKPGASATGFDGCPRKICARSTTCSPNRQVTISMAGSRATW